MLDSSSEAFHNGSAVSEAGAESAPGESLVGTVLAGRYRIERLLGSGGMGAVYRAEHVLMRKACAVKVLHREMTQVKEVVARFEREAVAAARIEHPNVAQAFDFGRLEDGSFYLVLEFIEGQSLSQRIAERGSLPEERALLIARQITEALAAAHAAGIVHRDLKPDNVMLVAKEGQSDFVKVLDFGIAKVKVDEQATTQQALTRLNTVMGTPEYMAPEQARGEAVDHRADLYTVGVILYEMLCGTSPFRHEEFVVTLTRKLTEDAPPLSPPVSQGTRELVAALLQRAPEARPQAATAITARIDGLLGYSPVPASAAFAPLSAPLPSSARNVSASAGAAFANTVIGDAVQPRPVTLVSRARPWLEPALSLAKRPISFGPRQVPLGALGAVLLLLPVLVALAFGLGSASTDGAASTAGAPLLVPDDDDLVELTKRAEAGEATALAELAGRAGKEKSAALYRSLGRGYFKNNQVDAGLRAYRAGAKLEPKLGDVPEVLADVRRGLGDPANQGLALEVASALGAGGADLLYDIYDDSRTSAAALSKQAKALLDDDNVQRNASPALKVALDLQKAKAEGCSAVKKLLPRVQEVGDARAAPTLTRMAERRGCGFLGLRDCFGCLRSGKDLANAQKAVLERPAPKVGG